MIAALAQKVSSGQRQGYASELAGLWSELARTLGRLDEVAGRPQDALERDEAPDLLARLQYELHLAGERVFGLRPPAGAEAPHAELAAALAEARDATGEVAAAVEAFGAEGAVPLVPEWRGALFRVRLARLRLDTPRTPAARAPAQAAPSVLAPLLAFTLTVAGAAIFVLGATLAAWPLWAAGMLAVVGGLLVYRP